MDGVSAGAEGGAPAEVPAGIAAKTPYRGSITYHPSGQRELVKLYSVVLTRKPEVLIGCPGKSGEHQSVRE